MANRTSLRPGRLFAGIAAALFGSFGRKKRAQQRAPSWRQFAHLRPRINWLKLALNAR